MALHDVVRAAVRHADRRAGILGERRQLGLQRLDENVELRLRPRSGVALVVDGDFDALRGFALEVYPRFTGLEAEEAQPPAVGRNDRLAGVEDAEARVAAAFGECLRRAGPSGGV